MHMTYACSQMCKILVSKASHSVSPPQDKELQLTEAKKQTVMFAEDKAKLLKELEAERLSPVL